MSADFAVGIVHHGEVALTAKAVRSVRAVEPSPSPLLVVWSEDTPPTDAAREELGSDVVLIEAGENLGFSGGANRLASEARSRGVEFLWLLNNDVVVTSDAAATLRRVLDEVDNAAIVGPRIVFPDGTLWHDGPILYWPSAHVESPGYRELPPDPRDPYDVEFVCGCAPLIRLSALADVDGFDERYFLYYEDVDLSLRLQKQGWRTLHVSEAEVTHRGSHAVRQHSSALARYYRTRNRRLLQQQHRPGTPAGNLGERIRALRYALTGRGREGRAIRAGLRDASVGRWGRRKEWE